MHALLLRISRLAIRVELSGAKILVQDFEVGIALQHCRINRWKHDGSCTCAAWLEVTAKRDVTRMVTRRSRGR